MGPLGSGKSVCCAVELFRRAREQKPDASGKRKTRFAVVRNTYGELKTTTVKTWLAWWGEHFGSFNGSPPMTHTISQSLADGTKIECEIIFLALDDEADAKKLLSLEVTGIYFNEVREIRRAIVEAADGRIGRYPSMAEGGPTWYGIIADTNMPDEDHWLYELDTSGAEGWEFFKQPGGVVKVDGKWVQNPAAENVKNLIPGYYQNQLAGKTEEWIQVYLASQYGRLPVEGAYFATEMAEAEQAGRIGDYTPSPDLSAHTFWDIGVSDYMAIWIGQAMEDQWIWLAYYENTGHSIDHYARWLTDWKIKHRVNFGDHVWPHDGAHRDAGILGGKTRSEVFAGLGFQAPIIMPKRDVIGDWIDASRVLIRKSRFDRDGCKSGLIHLRKYRRERDDVRNVYRDKPRHDEHSHGADAFQLAGMGRGRVSNNTVELPEINLDWVA